MKKSLIYQIAFILGLIIFTFVVFHLSTGWFTIVMPIFAAGIFVLILFSKDDKEDIKK